MTIRELTIPLRIELCNLWYQSAFLPQFIYGVWAQVIVKVSLLLINNVSGVVDGKCYFTQKNWSSLECNFYCTISPLQQKLCPFQKKPINSNYMNTQHTALPLSYSTRKEMNEKVLPPCTSQRGKISFFIKNSFPFAENDDIHRSEERRVGKECLE